MTDYTKENHWYGHNGEAMPVHPETEVQVMFVDGEKASEQADRFLWTRSPCDPGTIIAFRITRLYVEPRPAREWWVNRYYGSPNDDTLFASRAEADSAALDENRIECIHVREVLPEGDA